MLVPALVAGGGGMEGSGGAEMFKVQENKGESSSQYPSQTSSPLFISPISQFLGLIPLVTGFFFFIIIIFHIGSGNFLARFLI